MEDELWAEQWPVPPQALDVGTEYGRTRVYRWPGEGTPLAFLHGMGATSLAAHAVREAARRACGVGIDTIGDVGRSVPSAPIEDADALACGSTTTLAAAGIDGAHLVGHVVRRIPRRSTSLSAVRGERCGAVTLIESPGRLAPLPPRAFLVVGHADAVRRPCAGTRRGGVSPARGRCSKTLDS